MPDLVNPGKFLASESSFYPVLQADQQVQRRGRARPPQEPRAGRVALLGHSRATAQRPGWWQQPDVVWLNQPDNATTAEDELRFLQAA